MSTVQGNDRLATGGSPEASSGARRQTGSPKAPRSAGATSKRVTRAPSKAKGEIAPAVAETPVAVTTEVLHPRVLELYRSQVVPTMMQEFGYSNVMQVPRLKKVMLNIGLGEALTNPKAVESATRDLATISGQKPILTRARKSIAGFKLREGNPIGLSVTLRGSRMYHFVDRLLNAALPRIRDFRGISPRSFDGRGNFSLGIREQIIFSEIDFGRIERIRGFQVTLVTTAKTDAEAARLLGLLGMPFAREN